MRSALLVAVAGVGIIYELFKINPPRWLLILGYVVVIGLSLFRMTHRPATPQDESPNEAQTPHETTN